MKISPELKIHKCNACAAELQDSDFERCGITLQPPSQLFFDYVCPKCVHRGRYTVDFDADIADMFEALSALVDHQPRVHRAKIIPLRP